MPILGVVVEGEGDEAAHNATKVEDTPEKGDVEAFAGGGWVGGHHGALASPEEAGAQAEEGTSGDDKGLAGVMIVIQIRTHIQDVERAAKEEGFVRTKEVIDSAAQEAEDSEGGVEGGVSIVGSVRVYLATGTHAIYSIEHAWTAEADEANERDLEQGSVVVLG